MAENFARDRLALTPTRLAALAHLTQAIGEAVCQGDLDGALALLQERQTALAGLPGSEAGWQELAADLQPIQSLEAAILEFCRTWQDALRERLEGLNADLQARRRYLGPQDDNPLIDLRK